MVGDTLSDAAIGIHGYLDSGVYDERFEAEIRRVLGEMETLRELLDRNSIVVTADQPIFYTNEEARQFYAALREHV